MVCIIAVYPLFRNGISAEIQEIRPGARILSPFRPRRQKIPRAFAARGTNSVQMVSALRMGLAV